MNKKFTVALIVPFISLALVGSAFAQTATTAPSRTICALSQNLSRGSSQSALVSALQDFLSGQGYFSSQSIGVFGPLTLRAVVAFQKAEGVPMTGLVGPLTRAAILNRCNTMPIASSVKIYSMTPTAGPTGTEVTIDGFGFTSDNTIHFGNGVIMHVPISSQVAIACTTDPNCIGGMHQRLVFEVPSSINPACLYTMPMCAIASMQTQPGIYNVAVQNTNGMSNSAAFNVTGLSTAGVQISSITPTSGAVGTTVTLTGMGFDKTSVLRFGGGAVAHTTSADGTSVTFAVPTSIGAYCLPNQLCPMYMRLVTPGSYDVFLQNVDGTMVSNTVSFTVTSGTTASAPRIDSIAPQSASAGTVVSLSGSGFDASAVLHFYQNGQPYGTLSALTVNSASNASFVVPEWIGAYCHPSAICIMLAKSLPAGSYTVAVETKEGISNQVAFIKQGVTTNGTLSINGIDAPSTLALGTSGTWTVHAKASSLSPNLHYAVIWGDEMNNASAAIMIPAPHDVQSSATFTHAYQRSGTFTPIFTVTDDAGRSASVSATVVVTPLY